MLFSSISIWTMLHGVVLGGGFMVLFSAAVYGLWSLSTNGLSATGQQRQVRTLGMITGAMALVLWLTVLIGTIVSFPSYRADPPAGAEDLSKYPKAFLKADPELAWLHSLGMEWKEHMPWIPAMLMTSLAVVVARHGLHLARNKDLRNAAYMALGLIFGVVSFIAIIGVLINKAAPVS